MQDQPNPGKSKDRLSLQDLTLADLERDGYRDLTHLKKVQARAQGFGGRLRVWRRGQALGKQRYAFVVDLDPLGPHRLQSEEPQSVHDSLEKVEQAVVELENRYGTAR
jgi:hypothetical protein